MKSWSSHFAKRALRQGTKTSENTPITKDHSEVLGQQMRLTKPLKKVTRLLKPTKYGTSISQPMTYSKAISEDS